jgi:hypothetical protein
VTISLITYLQSTTNQARAPKQPLASIKQPRVHHPYFGFHFLCLFKDKPLPASATSINHNHHRNTSAARALPNLNQFQPPAKSAENEGEESPAHLSAHHGVAQGRKEKKLLLTTIPFQNCHAQAVNLLPVP